MDLDSEVYAFTGNYFAVLSHGSYMIDEAVIELKMETMTPEERKKQELILQNRREYMAKMKEEALYKKKMQELSEKDRKVKQAEEVRDSKANEMKFGAVIKKFEPPKEQRG